MLPSRNMADELDILQYLQRHVSVCEEVNGRSLASFVWVDFWTRGAEEVFLFLSNKKTNIAALTANVVSFRTRIKYKE